MSELSVKELIQNLSAAAKSSQEYSGISFYSKAIVAENNFRDIASPENIKLLLAYIAELESRRVRVELPPLEPDDGSDAQVAINAGIHNRAVNKCREAILSACSVAGIECEVV
jgi:hypothetical protein